MTAANQTGEQVVRRGRGARLLSSFLFCALTVVLIAGLQRTMHAYGGGQTWWNTYLEQPEDTVDVLLLGSSHAHSTTSPLDLWKDYGFTSFHLTGSSQGLETTHYFLLEALKTQKPRVVVLELYMIQGYQMNDQAMASNYDLMPWDEYKVRGYLAEAKSSLDFQYLLVPLLRDHTRWSTLTRDDFAKIWRGPEEPPPGLGHPVDFHVQDATVRDPEGELTAEAYARSLRTLEQIAQVCEEHDVQLLLYFCPQSLPEQSQRLQEIEEHLSAEYPRVRYLDMNDAAPTMGLDLTTDFTLADGHLNYWGALKANRFLGEYMVDTYRLDDKRDDPAYERWNDAARIYDEYVQTMLKASER